jgi:hypothetical protein
MKMKAKTTATKAPKSGEKSPRKSATKAAPKTQSVPETIATAYDPRLRLVKLVQKGNTFKIYRDSALKHKGIKSKDKAQEMFHFLSHDTQL